MPEVWGDLVSDEAPPAAMSLGKSNRDLAGALLKDANPIQEGSTP